VRVPTLHIFSGFRDKGALWLESVEGLEAANERMKQLAAEKPGPYFIFSTDTYNVVASIDTSIQSDGLCATCTCPWNSLQEGP
jgi:hypothetical protein